MTGIAEVNKDFQEPRVSPLTLLVYFFRGRSPLQSKEIISPVSVI